MALAMEPENSNRLTCGLRVGFNMENCSLVLLGSKAARTRIAISLKVSAARHSARELLEAELIMSWNASGGVFVNCTECIADHARNVVA